MSMILTKKEKNRNENMEFQINLMEFKFILYFLIIILRLYVSSQSTIL